MDFQTAIAYLPAEENTHDRRARPAIGYWWFFLFVFLANTVLSIVDGILFGDAQVLGGIFSLAVLVPAVCVAGRRLHDTGRSAWWLLICFVPVVGALVLIWWFIQRGEDGANEYGPDPLADAAA